MKCLKIFFSLLILLFVSAGLSGCFLIFPSPDPGEIVQMELGDNKLFTVNGPEESNIVFNRWEASYFNGYKISSQMHGNEFEFKTEYDDALPNKIQLSCALTEKKMKFTGGLCNSCSGQDCSPFPTPCFVWVSNTLDQVVWQIKIIQNPPIWNGNYIIENEADIQDLKDFSEITGDLIIFKTSFSNLEKLQNLPLIGRSIFIDDNDSLTSLKGLNITKVNGGLTISGNDALTNLDGLDNITSIGGRLTILKNRALTTLSGISNELTSVGGLRIFDNNNLTSLENLINITTVEGNLEIGGRFYYNNNGYIAGNDSLINLQGLENLTSLGGSLHIGDNDALTSLQALENITSIGGGLYIDNNIVLSNLEGLNQITTSDHLIIENNSALTSLDGLSNLCSIESSYNFDSIRIINNVKLCTNLAETLKDQILDCDIDSVSGDIHIYENKECP